jgi:thiol:disulfide interchange protein DsbC
MRPHPALPALAALLLLACGRAPEAGSSAPAADSAAAPSDPVAAEPVPDGDPRIALAAKMPDMKPENLRPTPVAGIYELAHNGEVSYISADGKYVFSGDLFQVTTDGEFPNLSEARRGELRLQMLAQLPESEMIVFGAARAPRTITVFTDVDCQWCQRMHAQIDEYNELGIRVRYLAYPRTGPDTDSWHALEAVWCAKDRGAALTEAKLGGRTESRQCETPVARHYELGQKMALTGTPGVILPSGELIPGYLPPKAMQEAIDEGVDAVAAR